MTEKTPAAPRWGLPDAVAGAAAWLLLSSLAQLIARMPEVAANPGLAFAVNQVVGGWLPFLVVVLVASFLRGRRSLGADFGLRFRALDIAIGILCGILLRFAAVGIAEFARLVSGSPSVPFSGGTGGDPVWFVLTAVIAASIVTPVIEELYFRGLVLRSIRNAILGRHDDGPVATWPARPRGGGAPDAGVAPDTGVAPGGGVIPGDPYVSERRRAVASTVAVVGSALLFAAFHIDGAPESAAAVSRLVTLLVVGLVLGCLAVLTRRLGPSILTHVVFNLSVAVLDLAAGSSGPTLG